MTIIEVYCNYLVSGQQQDQLDREYEAFIQGFELRDNLILLIDMARGTCIYERDNVKRIDNQCSSQLISAD